MADSSFYNNYTYIRFVDSAAEADSLAAEGGMADDVFFDRAGRIVFPVNRATLAENDSLLAELAGCVLPQLDRDSIEVLRIVLRGAASPEGPYENNRRLGERRAEALLSFLNAHLSHPLSDDVLSMQVTTEDYASLLLLMRRAGDADSDLVARICQRHLPTRDYAALKSELQAAKGGSLWQRLLREYFPELRAARLMLLVRSLPEGGAEAAVADTAVAVAACDTMSRELPVELPTAETMAPAAATAPRRELLAVKTNVLFDLAYMPGYDRWCPLPNIALEFYPRRGHFTVGVSLDFPWWRRYSDHKFFEVRNYQVEGRYYLRSSDGRAGGAFSGLYLQAYAHGGIFEIAFGAHRGWKGEGLGAGMGAGYVVPLSRNGHWRAEFGLQVGWFGCRYDPFQYENPVNPDYHDDLYYYKWTLAPEKFRRRQYRFSWLGPTRVGITLSYDLLYRKSERRAAP